MSLFDVIKYPVKENAVFIDIWKMKLPDEIRITWIDELETFDPPEDMFSEKGLDILRRIIREN